MKSKISVLGMIDWDSHLLAGLDQSLPDGVSWEDVQLNIIQECADLEVVISNPEILKRLITSWGKRKARAWDRYYKAISTTYDPLDNYDRTETETVNESGNDGRETGYTSSSADEEANTRTPNLTSTNETSAYNVTTYQPKDRNTQGGTEGFAGSRNNSTSSDTETSGNYQRAIGRSIRSRGNIGVTSSQDMLNQELDVTERLDIYAVITQDFKREFCLLVY